MEPYTLLGTYGENTVPLFERERRQDTQLVQRLQAELTETKRLLETQTRRQNDLEYVNEDLERRLEYEARERINLDAMKADDEKRWVQERLHLEEERKVWERKWDDECKRRAIVEERLRRAEKELYRMHQKKYDIEKTVRREESEKRKHEVYIVRSIEKDNNNLYRPRQSGASSAPPSQAASAASYLSIAPPSSSSTSMLNPRDAKPATVRQRQALSSAMDFFGL
ncbi:hypothetical protein DYB37_001750 [Aphanomyces astaci]|uniref:Uncharacterized protein n=1 Tax=Aphanomyces astaci TaxID=112090 RepID=A0A397DMQ4_APHAT|nr:hypothetical protein DYB36_004166 [Aphanomyces astaci]RHY50480.1 hypothetical protein DYB30_002984 [Aphanomyces astaci]RHY50767.1 hypothetical protein DYB34_005537 [Aphanomyces astaci]RHY64849.1 hypothetical protein DYB38_007046 [Aphanomyces astaci]RHY86438.1 hypothetical protein DYB31_005658 [Aphanomyces astaci]